MLEFVRIEAADGLHMHGVYEESGADVTIIHIHGKGGNFYENGFVRRMFAEYRRLGINFLSFNNRGHAQYVEATERGRLVYVGAAVERFDDCLLDLQAAVDYVVARGARPVLQGHSFGCEKAMFFGLHRNPDLPLILLSPSDGYRLQRGYIAPEAVEAQLVRLKNDYDLTYAEWLPDEEYGIRGPGVDYHVPITARALVDLMEGPAFQLLRADLAVDWKIRNPCYVYLGAADALQLDGADAMVRLLRDRFGNHEVAVFSGGDHHLRPVTDEVIDNIAAWLHRRPAW